MLTLKTIQYRSNEPANVIFSRITWATERASSFGLLLLKYKADNTSRPWIGVYNEDKLEFDIIKPRDFPNIQWFKFIVHGKITQHEGESIINITFKPVLQTLFFFFFIIVLTAGILASFIFEKHLSLQVTSLSLIFAIASFALLYRKLKKTELKITETLGL